MKIPSGSYYQRNINTLDKPVKILFYIAASYLLLYVFALAHIREIFPGASVFGLFFYDLSIAAIMGIMVYLLTAHIPRQERQTTITLQIEACFYKIQNFLQLPLSIYTTHIVDREDYIVYIPDDKQQEKILEYWKGSPEGRESSLFLSQIYLYITQLNLSLDNIKKLSRPEEAPFVIAHNIQELLTFIKPYTTQISTFQVEKYCLMGITEKEFLSQYSMFLHRIQEYLSSIDS